MSLSRNLLITPNVAGPFSIPAYLKNKSQKNVVSLSAFTHNGCQIQRNNIYLIIIWPMIISNKTYFSVVASCFSTPCRPSVTFFITVPRALSPENKTSKNLDQTNTI